ncbi:hypothetical protein HMPREF9212_0445 [Lactobacillus iners LactinV 03V1-b]|nr:hypothetical protein HMPREF9212_0445 [Lactobacillus iners LactinV 03V1-b]
MKNEPLVAVSSGEVGRSVKLNPTDLATLTNATFCDLLDK